MSLPTMLLSAAKSFGPVRPLSPRTVLSNKPGSVDLKGNFSGVLAHLLAGFVLVCGAGSAWAADPAAGKADFTAVCATCHSAQPGQNKIGPSLFGIVGRKTGSAAGYSYSPANLAANLVWDEATLDKYLKAPRAMIPGTKMTFAGIKDDTKRADVIAYLATLK